MSRGQLKERVFVGYKKQRLWSEVAAQEKKHLNLGWTPAAVL